MTEFFNLGLAPIVRLPSDSENDRESLTLLQKSLLLFLTWREYFYSQPKK